MKFRLSYTSYYSRPSPALKKEFDLHPDPAFWRNLEPGSYGYNEDYPEEDGIRGWFVEIKSLEQLDRLREIVDCRLVFDGPDDAGVRGLEVYDDYRE